jgi:hypothetical protein
MSMNENLKKYLDELIQEVEKELEEATTTGNVAGYQTPKAFSDKGKSDKKRKKKIATALGYSVVDDDVDNISEAIKGRNNKTGESFGMVIGSDKQGNNGYELTVRKMYNSRISSYGFIFDKDSNLTDIRDYGYSLDGKFPDMKGHASSTSVRPNKRETITQIAKITSPAFAKKIYQHVQKNNKMNESVNEGKKRYYQQDRVGSAKYTISYHDGKKKHKDGSDFFDIQTFKNKKDLAKFVNTLHKGGYVYGFNESVNEASKLAMGIAGFTGTRGVAVDDFINTHNIDAKKLFNFVKKGNLKDRMAFVSAIAGKPNNKMFKMITKQFGESVNESKVKRPVNRWLELKNDESMHPHKKMAMGLKELKYQLRETEKFFNWYNKIKTMNELDSNQYWKRTNKHIYSIKEKLINIAKTIQEIEK